VLIFEGRLHSNEDGTARDHVHAVESFGLQIAQAIVAVVVQNRSATTTQIAVSYDEGAISDATPMRSGGTLIAASALPAVSVPTTLRGQTSTAPLPYVRFKSSVSDTANALGWLDVAIYAGGRVP
jgi:hypothetical protein